MLRQHIELVKVKNTFNSSDMFTKHLDRSLLEEAVSQFGHRYVEGRSSIALELNIIGGQEFDKIMLGMIDRTGAAAGISTDEVRHIYICDEENGYDDEQEYTSMSDENNLHNSIYFTDDLNDKDFKICPKDAKWIDEDNMQARASEGAHRQGGDHRQDVLPNKKEERRALTKSDWLCMSV